MRSVVSARSSWRASGCRAVDGVEAADPSDRARSRCRVDGRGPGSGQPLDVARRADGARARPRRTVGEPRARAPRRRARPASRRRRARTCVPSAPAGAWRPPRRPARHSGALAGAAGAEPLLASPPPSPPAAARMASMRSALRIRVAAFTPIADGDRVELLAILAGRAPTARSAGPRSSASPSGPPLPRACTRNRGRARLSDLERQRVLSRIRNT